MAAAAEADRLYRNGQLGDAIAVLNEALRDDPTDLRGRTFLFELLCFSGAWERARKQLDAISASDPEARLGATWYKEALHAEERRQEMFRSGELPELGETPPRVGGTLNGEPFQDLRDADPQIGPRLETISGGRYVWIPFGHLARVEAEPPKRLRDLYWIRAQIEGSPEMGSRTGEVLLPAITPLACEHEDERVRLGRLTEWRQLESGQEVPVGQKMLLVDGEEFPFLEVRELIFTRAEP